MKLFLWPLVVWLALVGRAPRGRDRRGRRRGVAPAAPPVHEPRRLRAAPAEPRRDVRARGVHAVRAARPTSACPDTAARVVTVALGLGVLALAWRRRSLGLAIAAALVLSPIVWRHFFILLLVPLALSRPRFDAVWLIPIGMWVGDGTFNGAPWQTAVVPRARRARRSSLCERRRREPRRRRRSPLRDARLAADLDAHERRRSVASSTILAPRRAAGRRRGRDVRGRAAPTARSRSTSTTSSTPRRSCCSTGRTRSPARTPRSSDGKQPHLAAARRVPRLAAARCSRPGRPTGRSRSSGSRCFMLSLRIVGVRDWRVYGVFALWPSGDRRDPRLAPDAVPLPARRARLALPRRRGSRPGVAIGLAGAIKFFLWPLGVWLAAIGRARETARRRGASPAPRCCSSCRSRASTTTSARCSSSGARSTRTATRRSGSSCRSARPTELARAVDARHRRRAPRRLLAPGEPRRSRSPRRSCSRRSCGSTTTPSRRSRSRSSGRGSRRSGSCRSRRGAC